MFLNVIPKGISVHVVNVEVFPMTSFKLAILNGVYKISANVSINQRR